MKKHLIYIIPCLMILNACTEGRSSLTEEQRTVMEDGLLGGEENSRNSNSADAAAPQVDGSDLPEAPPADDGSHSVDLGAVPGQGPVTVTPAFPPSGGNGGNDYQPVGDSGHQAQPSGLVDQVQQLDDNTNLNGQAYDDGYQATGSRPEISESATIQIYDPFCNCYKTGPNNGPIDVKKVPKLQATGSDEDDDD